MENQPRKKSVRGTHLGNYQWLRITQRLRKTFDLPEHIYHCVLVGPDYLALLKRKVCPNSWNMLKHAKTIDVKRNAKTKAVQLVTLHSELSASDTRSNPNVEVTGAWLPWHTHTHTRLQVVYSNWNVSRDSSGQVASAQPNAFAQKVCVFRESQLKRLSLLSAFAIRTISRHIRSRSVGRLDSTNSRNTGKKLLQPFSYH